MISTPNMHFSESYIYEQIFRKVMTIRFCQKRFIGTTQYSTDHQCDQILRPAFMTKVGSFLIT